MHAGQAGEMALALLQRRVAPVAPVVAGDGLAVDQARRPLSAATSAREMRAAMTWTVLALIFLRWQWFWDFAAHRRHC